MTRIVLVICVHPRLSAPLLLLLFIRVHSRPFPKMGQENDR
jgi:hypothetical protein